MNFKFKDFTTVFLLRRYILNKKNNMWDWLELIAVLTLFHLAYNFGTVIPARVFGIKVEKFFIYADPWFSILRFRIGETEYGLGWLPLSSYVKMSGMIDEGNDTDTMHSEPQIWEFRAKPIWQRLVVMFTGPWMIVFTGVFGVVLLEGLDFSAFLALVLWSIIIMFLIITVTSVINRKKKVSALNNRFPAIASFTLILLAYIIFPVFLFYSINEIWQIWNPDFESQYQRFRSALRVNVLLAGCKVGILMGLVNFLPLPAFNGGAILFLLYEAFTKRPIPEKVLEYFSLIVFLMLIAIVAYFLYYSF